MTSDGRPVLTPQVALGIFIALVGVAFTLDNLGITRVDRLVRYWPVLPMAIGAILLMHADSSRDWLFGTVWMAVGGVLLAWNLGFLRVNLGDFVPLILVLIGLKLAFRSRASRPPALPPPVPPPETSYTDTSYSGASHAETPGTADAQSSWPPTSQLHDSRAQNDTSQTRKHGHVRSIAIMSGVVRRWPAAPFRGGELTAIMGGYELDLRLATIDGDETTIDVFTIWGGIEIRVPQTWVVENRALALMGGVEDNTKPIGGADRPRLIIRGFAIMGGVEIKN